MIYRTNVAVAGSSRTFPAKLPATTYRMEFKAERTILRLPFRFPGTKLSTLQVMLALIELSIRVWGLDRRNFMNKRN